MCFSQSTTVVIMQKCWRYSLGVRIQECLVGGWSKCGWSFQGLIPSNAFLIFSVTSCIESSEMLFVILQVLEDFELLEQLKYMTMSIPSTEIRKTRGTLKFLDCEHRQT